MRSHELAKLLLENPDVELICQKDAEGNGYSPLAGIDFNVLYLPENSYSGECLSTTWSAEEANMSSQDWENKKQEHGGKHAVLFPVN